MKNKALFLLISFLFIVALIYLFKSFFPGIPNQKLQPNNKIKIVASFYPLYFFASEIGGDRAEVSNITPVGAEPHDYEPTAREIANIESSNLLILNGGGIETWGNKIKDILTGTKIVILIAGDGLFSGKDPHIWLNPELAKIEADRIGASLSAIDPENKTYYLTNAKALENRLDLLDKKYESRLNNCRTRNFITSHSAFGYLANQYHLNQVSITGLSTDSEPSAKQLAKISQFAKTNNIKYIFFEKLVSPKLADTLASEIGANTLVLDPLEGISNNDISQGKNYFSLMEQNLINLETALQCSEI